VGLGAAIYFSLQTDTQSGREANRLSSKWTDVGDATRTSQYEIWGVSNAVTAVKFIVKGSGIINIPTDPPNYTNNAAAISGGLVAGDVYRNGDVLMIVH
jgi:hypothetical protein